MHKTEVFFLENYKHKMAKIPDNPTPHIHYSDVVGKPML